MNPQLAFSNLTRASRGLIALALAAAALPSYGLIVTPTGDASLLANSLLGAGVTLVGTPTLTGGNLDNSNSSAAIFSGGLSTGIGIDDGILLTSGYANLVTSSNDSSGHTGSFGGLGDAQLTDLAGVATNDATVLSFDFTTTTGDLFFQFAFASEEYNEYANSSFADTFGFFVDGINIAVLPGTSIPISINTVNGGNPLGTDPKNPGYFHNNDDGHLNFSYDGFTDVFTVSALGLSAGTHTIKLAIADGSDFNLDSGVFIKAGSFVTEPPPVGVPDTSSSMLLLGLGIATLASLRRFVARFVAAA